ncbi:hypothetical protein D3C85_283240 [compost metagenome]
MFELGARTRLARQIDLRIGQLRLRLQQVGLGGDARVEAVAGDLEHALVAVDGGIEQRDLRIALAQRKIIGGQFALRRQARRGQVGRAGGRACVRARHARTQAAPDIRLPRRADGRLEVVVRLLLAPATRAGAAARQVHGGEQRGALFAHQRARLLVGSDGGRHVLVRDFNAVGQLVQLRVAEQGPPGTPFQGVGRHGRLPAGRLLERLRRGGRRRFIGGADGAAGQQQESGSGGQCRQMACGDGGWNRFYLLHDCVLGLSGPGMRLNCCSSALRVRSLSSRM